jgi:hypothetical protein
MMDGTSQDENFNADSDQNLNSFDIRLSDPDRLEAFSDGVLSTTITLLVFDIVRPEYEPGHLLEKLQAQWPNYIAFLASFSYVGIIWLNHRAVFSRVRYCSRSLSARRRSFCSGTQSDTFTRWWRREILRRGTRACHSLAHLGCAEKSISRSGAALPCLPARCGIGEAVAIEHCRRNARKSQTTNAGQRWVRGDCRVASILPFVRLRRLSR